MRQGPLCAASGGADEEIGCFIRASNGPRFSNLRHTTMGDLIVGALCQSQSLQGGEALLFAERHQLGAPKAAEREGLKGAKDDECHD